MMHVKAADVKKLANDPSAAVREQLAAKIATDYRTGHFTNVEQTIANDIFRILLKDVEIRIRQALAQQLAHCPQTPHDIILKLARDRTEVAAPVLEHSTVLTEEDLTALVKSTREVVKLCAIARRDTVSESLSESLMETREALVMQELFSNKGAAIAEKTFDKSWEAIAAAPSLLEILVNRGGLPLTIAEKMYQAVGDEMKQHLAKQYKMNKPYVGKAMSDVKEWEMLGLAPADSKTTDNDTRIEDLIDDLHAKGHLTQSLMIRALCVGNLGMFETGIARLARVPRANARILLLDKNGKGLEAIYREAHMPDGFLEAVKILLKITLEETDYGQARPNDFRKRVIERIHVGQYQHTVDNMDYLLSVIGGKINATAAA